MKTWLAPAKLNLFLHIVGQREDGYHLLQSVIQLIDLCDRLTFTLQPDKIITCKNSNAEIHTDDDLCMKAARLLQSQLGINHGVEITVDKHIPVGAGMGGGSSDAATTLLALNEYWDAQFSLPELQSLGEQLGADVPAFIRGQSCWVEGIGEQLTPMQLEENWFVVVYPNVHTSTQMMFNHPDLTRNCAPLKIRDFLSMCNKETLVFEGMQNVFEPIACRQPDIERAFQWLNQFAPARLTGTGSAVFANCSTKKQAEKIAASSVKEFTTFVTKGINQSPVISLSEYNYPQHEVSEH